VFQVAAKSVFQSQLIAVSWQSPFFLFSDGEATVSLSPLQLTEFQHIFENSGHVFLFRNAKPELKTLLNLGVRVARPICLETLNALNGISEKLSDDLAPKDYIFALEANMKSLDNLGLRKLARLECLVTRVFAAMEHRGFPIDLGGWQNEIDAATKKMESAKTDFVALLPKSGPKDLFGQNDLNLENNQQVKEALENIIGRTLPNTSQHTLSSITHPAIAALLRYREHAKIVSTYGKSFLDHVNPVTGRLHACFEPMGTSTGRASCHSPNLQNLPKEKAFHDCIRAPEGRAFITADYAACELRILGSLSQDPTFIEAFAQDIDLHAFVAAKMFGVPVSKHENPQLRQRAKAINFGLMYGMGAKALARTLGVPELEAQALFEQYFKAYPKVKDYLEDSVNQALRAGYAKTVMGRRLFFPKETLAGPNARGELSRIAKNMPIQGTAADMVKLAMLWLHEKLAEFKDAGLVNMIHDELVVECAQSDAERIASIVKHEMEAAQNALLPNIRAKADVQIAATWQH